MQPPARFLRTASRPIVGSVAGASRRARPRVRGGENGPPRPLPRGRPEGKPWPGRALARPPPPSRPCRLGFRFLLPPLHFVSLSAHGRLMEGRVHSPLYPARPLSLDSRSPLRRVSAWRPAPCSPVPLREGCSALVPSATSHLTFWSHRSHLKIGASARLGHRGLAVPPRPSPWPL